MRSIILRENAFEATAIGSARGGPHTRGQRGTHSQGEATVALQPPSAPTPGNRHVLRTRFFSRSPMLTVPLYSRLICILRLVWTPTKITRMLAHIHIDIRHGRICAVAAFIHPDLHVHPRKVLALLIAASSSLLRCACTKVLVVARPPNRCSLGTVGIHTPPFSTIRVITATPTCHALIAAACHGARLQDVHQLDISSCRCDLAVCFYHACDTTRLK